jgi:Pectate lyase superfamily protein
MKSFIWLYFLLVSFSILAATVETPMLQNLDADSYKILNVADIIGKMPRVDVRFFGADGSDTTDDTLAIQDAIDYAESMKKTWAIPGSSGVGSIPEVYFPKGHYIINDTLVAGGYLNLAGDNALIEMTNSQKDIIYFSCYYNNVKNLKFVGGKSHLVFANPNTNGTLINIEGCEFHLSSNFSIRLIPSGAADHLSALVTIRNCKFRNNYQVIQNFADRCDVISCWVRIGYDTMIDGAAFSNRSGILAFQEMCGIPRPGAGETRKMNARWVDNYDGFIAVGSRFGGEDAGMPTVYNYAGISTVYPYVGGGKIIIKDSQLCVGSSQSNACVVRMFAVPQQLVIKDNYGLSNSDYVLIDSSLDINSCLDNINFLNDIVTFTIEPNLHNAAAGAIPEQLLPFVNPLKELYSSKPSTGHWEKGHILFNSSVDANSNAAIINTEAGEPGKWSYWGKTSPFPIGTQEATVISGNKGKYIFDVPDNKNFTVLVTIASDPDNSENTYKSSTFILSLDTGLNDTTNTDYLSYTILHTPSAGSPSGPVVSSIHFGNGDTGSNFRTASANGQVTVIWNNCYGSPRVSLEVLSLKK